MAPKSTAERRKKYRQKQKYQQRVKGSTATATNLVTEQNDDSAFSVAHIRSNKKHPESRKNTSKKP